MLNCPYCNTLHLEDRNSPPACARPIAGNVAADDSNHGISGGNMQIYGTYHPDEDQIKKSCYDANSNLMKGFVAEQASMYSTDGAARAAEVINYFTPDHIPVFATLAENFVLFDR